MTMKVSVDAIGCYLASLVGSYNYENAGPPTDMNEYLPEVPNMLAAFRHGEDDLHFVYAGLVKLARGNGLTESIVERLCSWSSMDVDADEIHPVLDFMLKLVEEELDPLTTENDVEFVYAWLSPLEWRAQHRVLNTGLRFVR